MVRGYLARAFDLFNVRDLDIIARAQALCDELTIGVVGDELIMQMHGRPPVVPFEERLALVRHIRGLHRVVVHCPSTSEQHGYDTVFEVAGEPIAPAGPGPVVTLPAGRHSTSPMLCDALNPELRESVA